MSRKAHGSNRSKLRFENLEKRLLLAAMNNVTVRVDGSTLIITGDNVANQVALTQVGGVFNVMGQGGTTINGQATAVAYPFPGGRRGIKDVKIDLKAGDDILTVGTHTPAPTVLPPISAHILGKLEINMGAGDDTVGIASTQVDGDTKINAGADVVNGDLVAIVFSQFGRNLEVNMPGTHGESFAIAGSSVRKEVELKTGAGADSALFFGLTCDELNVETGGGNDDVLATLIPGLVPPGTLTANEINVILHQPNIASIRAREAKFEAGAGADTFSFSDLAISKELKVEMGAGNDTLNLGLRANANLPIHGNSYGKAELDGGAGYDTLNFLGADLLPHGKTKIEHFELITGTRPSR
jgi:hypothetical protein